MYKIVFIFILIKILPLSIISAPLSSMKIDKELYEILSKDLSKQISGNVEIRIAHDQVAAIEDFRMKTADILITKNYSSQHAPLGLDKNILLLLVHQKNAIKQLSLEEIKMIFSEKRKLWSEFGWIKGKEKDDSIKILRNVGRGGILDQIFARIIGISEIGGSPLPPQYISDQLQQNQSTISYIANVPDHLSPSLKVLNIKMRSENKWKTYLPRSENYPLQYSTIFLYFQPFVEKNIQNSITEAACQIIKNRSTECHKFLSKLPKKSKCTREEELLMIEGCE